MKISHQAKKKLLDAACCLKRGCKDFDHKTCIEKHPGCVVVSWKTLMEVFK